MYFNSIKVRLEQAKGEELLAALNHFNSIKVRLERNGLFAQNHVYLFQFHKGAIRTTAKSCSGSKGKNFNSIKVRLERDTRFL